MSTWYPPFNLRNTEIPSIDEINYNLLTISDAISGQLNEQNWSWNAFGASGDRITYYARDIALKVYQKSVESDPGVFTGINVIILAGHGLWETILEGTINSKRGGQIWILANAAMYVEPDFGVMVAIEIDGNLVWQDALGSGDDNDLDFYFWKVGAVPHRESVGPKGIFTPMMIDSLQRVTAGPHNIKIKVRVGKDPRPAPAIMSRELIVIEMFS